MRTDRVARVRAGFARAALSIFKAGMWVGVLAVFLVIALIASGVESMLSG